MFKRYELKSVVAKNSSREYLIEGPKYQNISIYMSTDGFQVLAVFL